MAVNSPGSYSNSKSSRSPRHLPQIPTPQQQQLLSGHHTHNQLLQNLGCESPSVPRVFEFPPEHYPEIPNPNYDFEVFEKSESLSDSRSSLLPESIVTESTSNNSDSFSPSPGHSHRQMLLLAEAKTPVFQFCIKKKTFVKTYSYPPKSPMSAGPLGPVSRSRSPTSDGSPQAVSFPHNNSKPFQHTRRNSCFNLGRIKHPVSPTAIKATCFKHFGSNPRGAESTPKLFTVDFHEFNSNVADDQIVGNSEGPPCCNSDGTDKQFCIQRSTGTESAVTDSVASHEYGGDQERDSPKKVRSERMASASFNDSHGCPKEIVTYTTESSDDVSSSAKLKSTARKSTSDLTSLNADDVETEVAILSSPRRRGSMKGGLAYLASRRGSRDSQISNLSNVSNEDVGPLNFNAHPRGRQRRTSNFLELPVPDHIRPRVHSLPEKPYNPRAGDDLYRLRAFSITHKGVVNRGDSIISRRSRSNTSVNSSRNSNVSGERSPFEGSCCSGQGVAADSTESDIEEVPKYRVVLLGDSGVGKTALVSQFMTSEYMNTYDASLDDEFGEKTVSILLDGEESEMVFIDHPHVEMSVENSLSTYAPHACIVVYSIVSRGSFQVAEEMLNYLWQEHFTQDRSVIVVGNKSDLARSRKITVNEGKQLATSRECKFIETSSGIQHNVDELLVGALKQIRLRETRDKKLRRQGSKGKMLSKLHGSKTALSLNLARDILNKMCLNDSKSKSCENLHVL